MTRARMRCRLRRTERESGFTLVEMLIAMVILSVVLAMSFTVIVTLWRDTADVSARGEAVQQAKLAVEQIDRQVRSGNVVYAPAKEATPYFQLRIYTQANGVEKCVQWRVNGTQLQMRSWQSNWAAGGSVSGWGTVARDIVNTQLNPVTHAFDLAPGNGTSPAPSPDATTGRYPGSNLVSVDLFVQAAGQGAPVQVQDQFYGRNSQYGYDTSTCATTPPG